MASPACSLRGSSRWSLTRSSTLGSPALRVLPSGESAQPRVSRQVHCRSETRFQAKQTEVSWQCEVAGRQESVRCFSKASVSSRLGGLRQTAIRRTSARPPLSGPLHASGRYFQPPDHQRCRWQGHLSVERLCPPRQAAADDHHRRRVSAAVPAPYIASWVCPHSLLGLSRKPAPRRIIAALPATTAT